MDMNNIKDYYKVMYEGNKHSMKYRMYSNIAKKQLTRLYHEIDNMGYLNTNKDDPELTFYYFNGYFATILFDGDCFSVTLCFLPSIDSYVVSNIDLKVARSPKEVIDALHTLYIKSEEYISKHMNNIYAMQKEMAIHLRKRKLYK